jgi:hypothetical protein
MPREDGFFAMLDDMLREMSPVMRRCTLIGLGLGVGGVVLYLLVPFAGAKPIDYYLFTYDGGLFLLFLLVAGIVGGLIGGLFLGVIVEFFLNKVFGVKFDDPDSKRKKRKL